MRSYGPFDRAYRKKILARLDDSGGKQRDRLRNCCPDRAIRIHTRESILPCALFLQPSDLAQPPSADFQVVFK